MTLIQQILDRARNSRILVAGDIMIDVYDFCYTAHSRPSPELPDKKVYTAHRSAKMLGGAGNVAANLSSLGVETSLLAICGDDGNALEARRLCESAGIRSTLLTDASRPTTIKTRLYIDDHYLLRRDDELAHKVSGELSDAIIRSFVSALDHVDAVILSDYNKGFFVKEVAQAIIALCRNRSIPVVVDLKPANATIFSGATVVAPNLKEAREICPGFDSHQAESSLKIIHNILGAEKVVVTLSSEGMLIYEEGKPSHVLGRKVTAIDSCGCGDTVRACLTLGLVAGLSLAEAADFANYAASLAVQKLGTATLTPDELRKESVS
ncbi:MAG: bifunctional hydroxymethylpyrimidine kinase/phosphomethylpyrimidine kinase [Verrucomicrobia bacterium]|nr:bifunctional hydroxymethylpyrimidine kinase/phosphomethylpyrimidine kinase [Verrucomicrobiota bacterium]